MYFFYFFPAPFSCHGPFSTKLFYWSVYRLPSAVLGGWDWWRGEVLRRAVGSILSEQAGVHFARHIFYVETAENL